MIAGLIKQFKVHTMLRLTALLFAGAVLTKANLTKSLFPNPTQYRTARYPRILLTTEELQEIKSVQPKGTCLTFWQTQSFVSNGIFFGWWFEGPIGQFLTA